MQGFLQMLCLPIFTPAFVNVQGRQESSEPFLFAPVFTPSSLGCGSASQEALSLLIHHKLSNCWFFLMLSEINRV